MCHVFRCDTPARTIANTLRDICKKIMIERNLQHGFGKPAENGKLVVIDIPLMFFHHLFLTWWICL
jgi:amyloid beta (A4) precursor protein-binding family B protein 2 (Fe65-like)